MEAAWLASELAAGRSIESIAREAGRSPSTVAYWVNKHGLTSHHAARHRPRGGLTREQLEPLIEEGRSIREIATELGVSYTTVRHWLRRFGLTTPRARRLAQTAQARAESWQTVEGICPHHGQVTFIRRGAECFRCQRCRSEAVDRRRRKIKRLLVKEAGGACVLCGYSRTMAGLHFHHVDPAQVLWPWRARRDDVARDGPCGGREVRPAVLELPRRGRERNHATARAPTMRPVREDVSIGRG